MSPSTPKKKQENVATTSSLPAAEDSRNSKAQQQIPKVVKKRGAGATMASRRKRDDDYNWFKIDGTVTKYNFETGKAEEQSGSESTRGSGRGRGYSINRRGLGNGTRGSHSKGTGQQSSGSLKMEGAQYLGHIKSETGVPYYNKLSSRGMHKPSPSSTSGQTLSLSRLIKGSSPVRSKYNEWSPTNSAVPVPSPWTNQLAQFLNTGSNCKDRDNVSVAHRVVSEEAKKQAEASFGWFVPTNSFLNPIIPVFPRIQQNLPKNETKDHKNVTTTTKDIANKKSPGSQTPFLNFCENKKRSKKPSYIPFIDSDDSG